MNLDFIQKYTDVLQTYMPIYLQGAGYTISLSISSIIIGVILGTGLALMRMSPNKILQKLAYGYIQIIRGTPLLVQLFIIYYGLYVSNIELPDFLSGVIAISINSAAYIAEIIRSGIQAVDKGQMEAARSIGMSKRLAMQKIIYPQAVKNILPALGNEVATLIKETSIVSVLGLRDLMFASDIVRGATFMPFFPLVIVAVIYFILTTSVSKLVDMLERKMKQSD